MANIRIEWVPVQLFGLGLLGFDHLQLVYQPDEADPRSLQDNWYVIEGLRIVESGGVFLGVAGTDGRTTLSDANGGRTGADLVAAIGTPASRGSRIIVDDNAFSTWEAMASYARQIDIQDFPYSVYGLPGSPTPTINSSSVIASLLFAAGLDPALNLPFGLRLSPGTTTLIGTTEDDHLQIQSGFTTLLGGHGRDLLQGTNELGPVDKLYGGHDDDLFSWSRGFNIIHGGQPRLAYAEDGTDTVSYSGVGEVTIELNRYAIPDRAPDYFAIFEDGLDWLFSIELLVWDPNNDHIRLGRGVELIETGLSLKLSGETSAGPGDTIEFADAEGALLINAATSDAIYVTSEASTGEQGGLWIESAEWVTGSDYDDRIYLGERMRGAEGGAGNDLLDARLVSAFSGNSPQGYDADLDGGDGDDVLVSGSGWTWATGGEGADEFILSAITTSGSDFVEFAIGDASASDRLWVAYDFFNGSNGDYEGSSLLPVLGAIGTFEQLQEGSPLYFEWQLQNDILFGGDRTEGVITFIGQIEYMLAGNDLQIRFYLGEAQTSTYVIDDAGNTETIVDNIILTDTLTFVTVMDFQEGDLGIHFYDAGDAEYVTINGGVYPFYSAHDGIVQTITANGDMRDPLGPRPTAPSSDPALQENLEPPQHIDGTSGNDIIALAGTPGIVNAGAGNDQITGSAGRDVLNGGSGDDLIEGLGGNDTYVVDSAADQIIEHALGGIDLVQSSVDFILPSHVENLDLIGAAVTGYGNAAANRVTGNDQHNALTGLAGDDTFYGGLGNDILDGGQGSDGFVYGAGDGNDVIIDGGQQSETDVLVLTGISADGIFAFRRSSAANDLILSFAEGGSVVLKDYLAFSGASIDQVLFDYAMSWSRSDLDMRATMSPLLDNDPPQALDDLNLTVTGTGRTISASVLLSNDTDFDGDALTIVAVSDATGSDVSIDANGNVVLGATQSGEVFVSFTYTISDSVGGTSSARAEAAILPNTAPIAVHAIAGQSVTDGDNWTFALPEETFFDADGDYLYFDAALVGGMPLPDWLDFDDGTGTFSGIPQYHSDGMLDIAVTAFDGLDRASTSFTLHIAPSNIAPDARADVGFETSVDQPLEIATASLLANDSDADGDPISFVSAGNAENGDVEINAEGAIIFTPLSGYTGPAAFSYSITDGRGGDANAVAEIQVRPDPNQLIVDTVSGVLIGTTDRDVLRGGIGNDTITGAGSRDKLFGQAGDDLLRGGGGNDRLFGGAGRDKLFGDRGDDWLWGGRGNDSLDGGPGYDTAVVMGLRSQFSLDQTGPRYVLRDLDLDNGNEGRDTLVNIERIQFDDGFWAL